jgi:hypothetical protein
MFTFKTTKKVTKKHQRKKKLECPQCHAIGKFHKLDCKDDSNKYQTMSLRVEL